MEPYFENLLSCRGREAKENNIFFVAHSSTLLSYALAEDPEGLRRLAARRWLMHFLLYILMIKNFKKFSRVSLKRA